MRSNNPASPTKFGCPISRALFAREVGILILPGAPSLRSAQGRRFAPFAKRGDFDPLPA